MYPKLSRLAPVLSLVAVPGLLVGAPTAADDAYTVNEDAVLTVTASSLIDTDFDGGGGGGEVAFWSPDWDYLDQIENQNGASLGYPTDGSGRAWNHPDFDPATSTVGPWGAAPLPLQSGGINGLPGEPDILAGVGSASNGENLVTTYLFRNRFVLGSVPSPGETWVVDLLADDGCVIYVNGVEVLRRRLAGGALTTETFGSNSDESYQAEALSIPDGLLVAGMNVIAVELHQAALSSSDVGLDLVLRRGAIDDGPAGGFSYSDDEFSTANPELSEGSVEADGGFESTAGLHVRAGGNAPRLGDRSSSGGWSRDFELGVAATVEISLRYRLIANEGFENAEFVMALAAVGEVLLGEEENNSLAFFRGDGNGGGDDDTGWRQGTFSLPLAAGSHTLSLGIFINQSTVASEVGDVYFDDVVVGVSSGGGGAGGVLGNDSGEEASLAAEVLTLPAHGSISGEPDGTFTYTPDANFFGEDSFTYRATDNTGNSAPATVTITVNPVNDAPTGAGGIYPSVEDELLVVAAAEGVLASASDIDHSPAELVAVLETDVAHGSLVLDPDGAFTYSPDSNFFGTDGFAFRVSDGVAESDPLTVTIEVAPVPDPPVAVGDSYSVDENAQLQVTLAQGGGSGDVELIAAGGSWRFLADGSDQGVGWIATTFDDSSWDSGVAQFGYGDGDEATVIGFGPDPDNKYATTYFRSSFEFDRPGVIEFLQMRLIRDDGAAVYLNGVEIARSNLEFEAAFDTRAPTSTTNENAWRDFDVDPGLLVVGTNHVAVELHQHDPDSSDLSFDLSLTGTETSVRGVLANDSDPDGDLLSAVVASPPAHGGVVLNSDGTFTYTPDPNYFGEDAFQYRVTGGGLSSVGTATVTVIPGPNDVPETVEDSFAATEDENLEVGAAAGVLANDSDPDGDQIEAVLVTDVSHGSLALAADGSFEYLPGENFSGADWFVYRARDALGESVGTLVVITVTGVNDAPLAQPDLFVVQPGQVFAGGVLGNDSDVDGDPLSAVLVVDVGAGVLDLGSDGAFTYDPSGATGTTSFRYRADDGAAVSAEVGVTLVIDGRPSAIADGYAVTEDNKLQVSAALGVLGNDSDPEGQSITAILQLGVSDGELEFSADGSFSYTPDADFSGTDSFTYVVADGVQHSAPAVVTISVTPVNDPPVAQDDDYGVVTGQPAVADAEDGVLGNDTDADGDELSATLLTDVSSGALALAADGSFTYTPAGGFEGDDSFTYRVSDGVVGVTATATFHVGPDLGSMVINEIMYHPASDNDAEEYIELVNTGENPVDLTGWAFGDGVDFTFPAVTVQPGGFLVIAADVAAFTASYGAVADLVGGWDGRLSNAGERLRLYDDDGVEIDDVSYADQGEWAARERLGAESGWGWNGDHDGGGQSLELVFPGVSNKHGQNWAPSQGAPTPGAANSVAATAIAPLILDVAHAPAVPGATDPVRITARLLDVEGTQFSASLFWRQAPMSPGEFAQLAMADDGANGDGEAGDGVFGATLPALPDGTVVEFYVSASDESDGRTWPAATNLGQVANAHYQVDDEVHAGGFPVYRIVMTAQEDEAWTNVNRSSNERFHATLILDDCSGPEIRYNSSIRVRGAGSRSHNPPPMRVSVPHDRPWNERTDMNWNTKYTYSQYIGMRLFQGSGMAAPDGKPMSVRWNGEDRMRGDGFDYGMAVHMEVLDGDFIDDKFPDDADGNLYKKVRPDLDWTFRDGDAGDYRSDGWSKETNEDEDEWGDLDAWLDVMNNAPGDGDYVAQVESVVDLDQWLRWFGAMAIVANGETNPSTGVDDDHSLYSGVVDGRIRLIPHDLDTILGNGDGSRITDPEHTIFDMISRGAVLDPLVPLFSDPAVQVRYYQALRELLQGSFAKEEFDELVENSLAGWVPAGEISDIIGFMDARRSYITGLVDAELGAPPPPPAATTAATLVGGHGDLMISEVLASNTALDYFGTFPDFVELYNAGSSSVDLGGMTVTDDLAEPARFVFPGGTILAAGRRLLLIADGDPTTPGIHLGFGLGAKGDAIYLIDGATTVDGVSFGLQIPDQSIGRTGAGLNTWALCQPTPGTANTPQPTGDPDGLRLNEWLTQPEVVFGRDFIELYNSAALPVAIGGLAISDEPASDPARVQLPALSFIAAGGFSLFEAIGSNASPGNASELAFKLGSDQGWLAISGTNGVEIDEVHYLCHRQDVSQGRSPDGASTYADFTLPTPGFSNTTELANEAAIVAGLRITEIMYHPASGNLEYVELRNTGDLPFDLGGVAFTEGIRFEFPPMVLQPGEYVLAVEDAGAIAAAYGPDLNVAGAYDGKLSNGGERLRLELPALGAGILDFDYDDAWYPSTDGGGFALEIIDEAGAPASWGSKQSWQAGALEGGSPGSAGGDPAAYEDWVIAEFGTAAAGITGKLDDPDSDGLANLLEFVLGSDPETGQQDNALTFSNEGGFLTLTYRRAVAAIGLVDLESQVSGDTRTWSAGGGLTIEELISSDGVYETWKVRDAVPIGVGERRFLRLRATCLDDR